MEQRYHLSVVRLQCGVVHHSARLPVVRTYGQLRAYELQAGLPSRKSLIQPSREGRLRAVILISMLLVMDLSGRVLSAGLRGPPVRGEQRVNKPLRA